MTDIPEQYRPLEEVARAYAAALGEETNDAAWQVAIDSVGDHNQMMIDTIEDISPPTIEAIIDELMHSQTDAAATAWTALINYIFERAQAIYETHE